MNNWIFPFHLVKQGADIILYGAGNVGLCFYKQLITTKYASVVAWVDRNWQKYKRLDMPVEAVEKIREFEEYDYVVIAIESKSIADEICKMLMENGIEEDKIIHSEYHFPDTGLYKDFKQEIKECDLTEQLTQISPHKLLKANRLDLAVRYLVAKDILHGRENERNLSLYTRMILARADAYEGMDYFSEYAREGTQEYLNAMRGLCNSMRENGFDREKFVPIGNNGILLNGAHRVSVALALEEDIWVKRYNGQTGNENYGMEWFEENGFNIEDKIRILRAFADLYGNCGILLLFGPCIEQWGYLEAQLEKQMTVVGTVELDFSDNYIAFENLLREIYSDPLWRNVYIDRKTELLKMAPLKIKILLVSDEGYKNNDLYQVIAATKLELRDRMYFDTDIAPVVIHGSNSKEEFEHLRAVLLSVNNLRYQKMRIARNYSEEIVKRIDRMHYMLTEKGISINDVCISGSSGFEIFGLRKAADLDFFVKGEYRNAFGEVTVSWSDDIEYVRKNSISVSDDDMYEDDLLIEDDNYHYVFYGCKFVNLDIIAQKKKYNHREKDMRDVRLYQLFKDYVSNFDDKEVLKKQIEKEFYKKR